MSLSGYVKRGGDKSWNVMSKKMPYHAGTITGDNFHYHPRGGHNLPHDTTRHDKELFRRIPKQNGQTNSSITNPRHNSVLGTRQNLDRGFVETEVGGGDAEKYKIRLLSSITRINDARD